MNDAHDRHNLAVVRCAVVTISDSRTPETDHSGRRTRELVTQAGHCVVGYLLIPDEPSHIKEAIEDLAAAGECHAALLNGGTGLSPRDATCATLEQLLERRLEGFGELFRVLSYEDIGPRAMLSGATAGCYKKLLLYAMPGATAAVELALTKLILPTLAHTVGVVRSSDP